MRKVELAYDLSGKPLKLITETHGDEWFPTNVGDSESEIIVSVDVEEERRAFDLLPKPIQHWLSERCPIDQAAVAVLEQWDSAKAKGYSVPMFLRYMEHVLIKYLNETKDVWPTSPPDLKELPSWERHT